MASLLQAMKGTQRGSLFGITPQELEARRQQERRQTLTEQVATASAQSPTPALTSLGVAIGSALGQGLLSRFGGEDLEMQQAQENKRRADALQERLNSIDTSTPEGLLEMANIQNQVGNSSVAVQLANSALNLRKFQQAESAEQSKRERAEQALKIIQSIPVDSEKPLVGMKKQYSALISAGFPEQARRVLEDMEYIQDAAGGGKVTLSAGQQKRISELEERAQQSLTLERQLINVSDRFEKELPIGGTAAQVVDGLKNFFGVQDGVSELRRITTDLRNRQVLQNLPAGAASDRDVALVLEGFLDPFTTNPKTMANYLRGLAKAARYDIERNKYISEFISTRGTESQATNSWEVEGIPAYQNRYLNMTGKGAGDNERPATTPPPPMEGGTKREPTNITFGGSGGDIPMVGTGE